MAREMYLAGVDPSELLPDPKPEGPRTPREKWQNFWYHYKWHTVAAIFAACVAGVLLWQMFTRVNPDYRVVLVTKDVPEPVVIAMLTEELRAGGIDLNGDGDVIVEIESLSLGQFVGGKTNSMSPTYCQKLAAYLQAGSPMVYLFDDASYRLYLEDVLNGNIFYDTPSVPSEHIDPVKGYYNWNGTAASRTEWGERLPQDLYFGVRKAVGTAANSTDEHDAGMALIEHFIEKNDK